jgi:hypothetical protein
VEWNSAPPVLAGTDAYGAGGASSPNFRVATRLQQKTAPGTILLSTATYALVHTEVHAEPCGTLALDGPSSPTPVYTVQGLLRRNASVSGRGSRAASPFVGRERELALLHAAWRQCVRARARSSAWWASRAWARPGW